MPGAGLKLLGVFSLERRGLKRDLSAATISSPGEEEG